MPVYNHVVVDSKDLPTSDGLVTDGILLAVEVSLHPALEVAFQKGGKPIPPPAVGKALLDTGCTFTCVDAAVLTELGIPTMGEVNIGTAGGAKTFGQFPATISFPGSPLPTIRSVVVGADLAAQGLMCLIGRDLLQNFIVVYNGPGGLITIAG